MPISEETFNFVGYAFVDDTDVIQSNPESSVQDILRDLQAATDTWEKGLRTTYGRWFQKSYMVQWPMEIRI